MLSVIIDVQAAEAELPILLAALTAGAVDGIVRDVVISAPAMTPLLEALREETGAEVVHGGLTEAAGRARHDRVLVVPADLRLRGDWIALLKDHLARGGRNAVLRGEKTGGWLRPAGYGVLIGRDQAAGLAHADLKRLRGKLGAGAALIR